MRHPRVIWRLIRKLSNRWLRPAPSSHSIAVFDPKEFSDLISSGRNQDLETLARRLSEHHGKSPTNVIQRAARSKSN